MTASHVLRRLDHIGIVVRNTDDALRYFSETLGLQVVASEEIASPYVRLTYLDAGNTFIQLIEPLDSGSPIAASLEDSGEGIHHLCFGVDNVAETATHLNGGDDEVSLGGGRSRVSAFIPGDPRHGVRLELTEFVHREDVLDNPGWLS